MHHGESYTVNKYLCVPRLFPLMACDPLILLACF